MTKNDYEHGPKLSKQRLSCPLNIVIFELSIDYFNNRDQKQNTTFNQARKNLCLYFILRQMKLKIETATPNLNFSDSYKNISS